jgi:lactoylglutathione lyase
VNRGASGASAIRAQAATFAGKDEAIAWAKGDNRRLLHVVYRVGDLDRTIKYCTSVSVHRRRRRAINICPRSKYNPHATAS